MLPAQGAFPLGPTTRRFARRLADTLAGVAGASHVIVVDDARSGSVAVGPRVSSERSLLDVVLPSAATVCPLHRLPASVRAALHPWAADAVVVVPAVFGNDLVAVGVAPVDADVPVPLRRLDDEAQRVAAGITLARLIEAVRAA
ncbi:MAG TPA: hypothetical protein VG478_12170 [Acidimicrobiales bacterium]|jgi:hypothetical protein|nr:hypothetical protein [Acidimicrobiales bacterium]